jgi:hypothetical protein
MTRRSILQNKNIKFGDKVCIFELPANLYTVTLSFDNGVHLIELEEQCPKNIIAEIHNQFISVIEVIKTLDTTFLDCIYLFTYYNNELKLLSYSKEGTPFSYKTTKLLGRTIKSPVLIPTWEGTFTSMTAYAFLEDIFVQRSE